MTKTKIKILFILLISFIVAIIVLGIVQSFVIGNLENQQKQTEEQYKSLQDKEDYIKNQTSLKPFSNTIFLEYIGEHYEQTR